MGRKKGVKIKEKTKDILYQIRVDEETDRKTKEICRIESLSKSEVVRQGIELKFLKMQDFHKLENDENE